MQRPKDLGHLLLLFQTHQQEAGSETEQPRVKQMPIRSVAAAGGDLVCYALEEIWEQGKLTVTYFIRI